MKLPDPITPIQKRKNIFKEIIPQRRDFCDRCVKPKPLCLCERIKLVENRTNIYVLQHYRERHHPIGTERIIRLGLRNVKVHVLFNNGPNRSSKAVELPPDTAVLYPSQEARELTALKEEERPKNLVVLDGTWSHANRLYKDNEWIHTLPHYCLTPENPSRYRIRKEPRVECISTLEAVIEALYILEPEIQGLEQLSSVFESMIDDQILYAQSAARNPRQKRKRPKIEATS